MATYLRDIRNNVITATAIFPAGAVTATATGPALDLLEGDGNCHAYFHVGSGTGSTGPAGVTPRVLGTAEGGTAGGTYTVLSTMTFAGTTGGTGSQWSEPFQRTGRYVKMDFLVAGTAANFVGVHAFVIEQRKYKGTPTSAES